MYARACSLVHTLACRGPASRVRSPSRSPGGCGRRRWDRRGEFLEALVPAPPSHRPFLGGATSHLGFRKVSHLGAWETGREAVERGTELGHGAPRRVWRGHEGREVPDDLHPRPGCGRGHTIQTHLVGVRAGGHRAALGEESREGRLSSGEPQGALRQRLSVGAEGEPTKHPRGLGRGQDRRDRASGGSGQIRGVSGKEGDPSEAALGVSRRPAPTSSGPLSRPACPPGRCCVLQPWAWPGSREPWP